MEERRIIRTQLDKAYKSGYEDAKSELGKNAINLAHEERDRAYQQGLDEAWEAVKKIFRMDYNTVRELFGDFLVDHITQEYCVSDVLQIIKEYEEAQDTEIKVGDEVFYFDKNDLRVVVRISNQMDVVQITSDGKCAVNDVKELHRTGRTFPQVAEIFSEMRGEE